MLGGQLALMFIQGYGTSMQRRVEMEHLGK